MTLIANADQKQSSLHRSSVTLLTSKIAVCNSLKGEGKAEIDGGTPLTVASP